VHHQGMDRHDDHAARRGGPAVPGHDGLAGPPGSSARTPGRQWRGHDPPPAHAHQRHRRDIFTDTGRGADCVERYAGELAKAARIFPPGAAYSYCNSGFVLLGRIIEVLDGRDWDASLRERLIGPLGLAQTVTLPEEAILHRAATGHRQRPRQDEPVSVWGLPRSVGPA